MDLSEWATRCYDHENEVTLIRRELEFIHLMVSDLGSTPAADESNEVEALGGPCLYTQDGLTDAEIAGLFPSPPSIDEGALKPSKERHKMSWRDGRPLYRLIGDLIERERRKSIQQLDGT